jgi:vacuolar-type H+-ATPase subunit I/STV1
MKTHLQNLLDSKEKQLQQAGSLGQRVLAQQMELEERIRQLQEVIEEGKGEDDDEERLDEETRERYRQLADTLLAWDEENARLSSAFGSGAKVCVSRIALCYHTHSSPHSVF